MISDSALNQRLQILVGDVARLAEDRARKQAAMERSLLTHTQTAESEHTEQRQAVTQRFDDRCHSLEQEYATSRERILAQFESESTGAMQEFQVTRARIEAEFLAERAALKKRFREQRWEAQAVFEAACDGAKSELRARERQLVERLDALKALQHEAAALLRQCGQHRVVAELNNRSWVGGGVGSFESCFDDASRAVQSAVENLQSELLVKLFRGWVPLGIIAGSGFVILLLATVLTGSLAMGVAAATILLLAAILSVGPPAFLRLRKLAAKQYAIICQSVADAALARQAYRQHAVGQLRRQRQHAAESKSAEAHRSAEQYRRERARIRRRRDTQKREMNEKYPRLLADLRQRRDQQLQQIDEKYPRLFDELEKERAQELGRVETRFRAAIKASRANYETEQVALANQWRSDMSRCTGEFGRLIGHCAQLFPSWETLASGSWAPPTAAPRFVRIGTVRLRLADVPHAVPDDPRLRGDWPAEFPLPALVEFPQRASLLFEIQDTGRAEVESALQAILLRLLTAAPPGKARLTIIDPVGLGKSFAAFMHLADYDPNLVTSRIWTEPVHIEQRLADLTEHMEDVIQKYLRNQYASIEDYNADAGEVAEPYRFLVVANFPTGFGEAAMRRLISIATSGPRCGVFTLLSVDRRQTLPQGVSIRELSAHSTRFVWQSGRVVWKDPQFGRLPLELEAPPDDAAATAILHRVGEQAKAALRVEVPFEFVAPSPDECWTANAQLGIVVPLGRTGATKRQQLELGRGTAQHVLIAGKTGSGKSTLLHVLITNAALRYSPDQLELYLIDFKKGVEFKCYAAGKLPHTRVIAIESEREFGLSVLSRIDAELKLRGEKFRHVGVQDLASYRDVRPSEILPRILLVVDEFQEFFVEDDKLAQDAALLLDRLVRQGRAFGIHVLLGSQTLGGAYSLARSTVDQMAVRIALQCSATDGHLVLSETNSAAKLLTRPGEAIYNDANGLVEGNHPFQIVWLPDDRRDHYLSRIAELARARDYSPPAPPVVFEGNAPADLESNRPLLDMVRSVSWPTWRGSAEVWLGEAVAIKDPTAAVVRRQSGRNLLVLGQNLELSLGVLASAVLSLAAQQSPDAPDASSASFVVLDGRPAESQNPGFWSRFVGVVPHAIELATGRDAAIVVARLADELERRKADDDDQAPAIYLIVDNVSRFRDLRRTEDDLGFRSSTDEATDSTADQFRNLLRDGPPFGIHTIAWCDSLNALQRTFDRPTLREFELRVLFQMSANDSSTLIDTPAAARLGPFRALFSSEDEGYLEKFRPYGVPEFDFLDRMRGLLSAKRADSPQAAT
jgi:hypothetical protein